MARTSIYTVAERAGVSIATVSRVLRNSARVAPATRERVLAAVNELGWRPSSVARGLAGRGHGAAAIVFPDLLGPYFSQIVLGFEEQAVADDRSVLILATHGRPNADVMVHDLTARVDGLVVMDRTISDEVVCALDERGVPIVLLARPEVDRVPAVRTENLTTARQLTAHLLGHGRTRVRFLGDPEAAPDVDERWRGFRAAFADAGLRVADKPARCGFLQDDGYACGVELLDSHEPPDAIVCANDELALGIIAAARDLGLRVPGDVAVTGWDDIPAARAVAPSLTTARQPLRQLGRHAGALLSARIARATDTTSTTLPTEIVLRHSCGCAPDPAPRRRPR